jgi:hypothetical protein
MPPVSRYDDVEEFWGAILSEEPYKVLAAWGTLDGEERHDVRTHLLRMSDPLESYAEVQQQAARFALRTIGDGESS